MVQIHSPRPILLGPMSYSSKKSGRLLGRGPGGLWLESIRPLAKTSYTCKMNDLAQRSIRTHQVGFFYDRVAPPSSTWPIPPPATASSNPPICRD
jgi:hypothetical protein